MRVRVTIDFLTDDDGEAHVVEVHHSSPAMNGNLNSRLNNRGGLPPDKSAAVIEAVRGVLPKRLGGRG